MRGSESNQHGPKNQAFTGQSVIFKGRQGYVCVKEVNQTRDDFVAENATLGAAHPHLLQRKRALAGMTIELR